MHFFSLSKSALFSPHFTSFQSFWGCLIMLCVFALCGQFERFNAFISTLPSEHLTVNSPYGAISPAYLLDSLERHCEIIAFFGRSVKLRYCSQRENKAKTSKPADFNQLAWHRHPKADQIEKLVLWLERIEREKNANFVRWVNVLCCVWTARYVQVHQSDSKNKSCHLAHHHFSCFWLAVDWYHLVICINLSQAPKPLRSLFSPSTHSKRRERRTHKTCCRNL